MLQSKPLYWFIYEINLYFLARTVSIAEYFNILTIGVKLCIRHYNFIVLLTKHDTINKLKFSNEFKIRFVYNIIIECKIIFNSRKLTQNIGKMLSCIYP